MYEVSRISEWWPLLDEQIRRWLVNNYWSPLAQFTQTEIARAGGPAADDAYWDVRDNERYLPHDAVVWIIKCSDFERFSMPKKPDPRAAYFRRGWPHRQS